MPGDPVEEMVRGREDEWKGGGEWKGGTWDGDWTTKVFKGFVL